MVRKRAYPQIDRRNRELAFVRRNLDSLNKLQRESPEDGDLIRETLSLGKTGFRNMARMYDKLEPKEEIKYVKAFIRLEQIVKKNNPRELISKESAITRAIRKDYRKGIEEKTEIIKPQTQPKKLYSVSELFQRLREIATGSNKNRYATIPESKIPGYNERRIELIHEAKKNGIPICIFEKPTSLMDLEGINELFNEFSEYRSRLRKLFSSAEPEDYGYCIMGIRRPEKIMPNMGYSYPINARFRFLENYISRKKELATNPKYASSQNSDIPEGSLSSED